MLGLRSLPVFALTLALPLTQGGCGHDSCPDGAACSQRAAPSTADASRDGGSPDGAAKAPRPPRIVKVDEACVVQSVRAEHGVRPVDVILVIDNSGSMDQEIAAVRASINDHFAAIIDESGVDLRVILISQYGSEGTSVCVEPPLAGAPCSQGLASTNGGRFFHYDLAIGSNDALCYLLASFDHPDDAGRAPDGFRAWLRPEAAKAFVAITDDSVRCAYQEQGQEIAFGAGTTPHEDALLFHQTLLSKAPEQFGTPPDTRYQFFSIVGLAGGTTPGEPLLPHEPLSERTCDTAMTSGLSYQALSVVTDALRYPVCEGRSFDQVFRVLARSVVAASSADCTFELPKASARGEAIILSTISLSLRTSQGGPAQPFVQVASQSACDDSGSFYIDERAGHIELCPSACTVVKRNEAPEIELLYGCEVFVQ